MKILHIYDPRTMELIARIEARTEAECRAILKGVYDKNYPRSIIPFTSVAELQARRSKQELTRI